MIPQTEMIKPQSESFGPQILMILNQLLHRKPFKFRDLLFFSQLKRKVFRHVIEREGVDM